MIYQFKQPNKIQIYVNTGRKTMAQIKAETGCDVIINGGLYDMATFTPNCHLKVSDVVLHDEDWTRDGYGWNTNQLEVTKDMGKYSNYITCVDLIADSKAVELSYPDSLGGVRGRSAMGVMPDSSLILVCIGDGLQGCMSPEQLQAYMMAQGCKSAIMLDGGGSSQCIAPNGQVTSSRIVHNYICFYFEEAKKVPKIYISPSTQEANPYKVGNTNEETVLNEIADFIVPDLERHGVTVFRNKPEMNLYQVVDDSNSSKPDYHVALHTNASSNGTARGCMCFVYSSASKGYEMAQKILAEVAIITPTDDIGLNVHPTYYELNATDAPSCIIEYAFHDNADDATWILAHKQELATATVKGILNQLGIAYIPPMPDAVTWANGKGLDCTGLDKAMTKIEVLTMLMKLEGIK